MQLLANNNASTTLAAGITNVATSCQVAPGTGVKFPAPAAGQYFVMTFTDAATGQLNEIVWVTDVTGDVLTITRAKEGTSAQAWASGDFASNLMTAGQLLLMVQPGDLQAQAGNGAVDTGTKNAGAITLNPVPISLAAIQYAPITVKKMGTANDAAYTLNINSLGPTAVKHVDGSDLVAGELPASGLFTVRYNGTNLTLTSNSLVNTPLTNPTVGTQSPGDVSTKAASTAFLNTALVPYALSAAVTAAIAAAIAPLAPLASPALSGVPTGPTAAPGTSTTQLATTAFVQTAMGTVHQSGSAAYVGDTNYVLAHNIGGDPNQIEGRLVMVCTTNDWSFTVGQVMQWNSSVQPDNGNGMLTIFTEPDGNTTTFRLKSHLNAADSGMVNRILTNGKWNVYVECWARGR